MRLSSAPVFVALGLALAAADSRADPSPADAAYCVAALKARAAPLAEHVRRGDAGAEARLLPIVTASFAFIGAAYKQGVRQAEADRLVAQAEEAQLRMPTAELGKVQESCQRQGQQLYDHASHFERQFVAHAVRARIDRLKATS